jgi:phosphoribosylamine---glycine ligase
MSTSESTRVLVVGSGAREHALARAVAGEGREVLVAPGNGGTAGVGRNVPVRVDDVAGLVELAARERVALVVVGPELPLTLGLVDALAARKIPAFGPSRAAARLEGSKAFMKLFLKRHSIRTAPFEVFDDPAAAEEHVRRAARPLVVKADGLAAGKGVVVARTTDEAVDAVDRAMRKNEFGEAGRTVVIEEVLAGEEASFHVISDGERFLPLAPAQDHKRVADGDAGPNTGGMGAYAPAPVVTPEVRARVLREIVEPTLRGMAAEGAPFRGVLFVGLMIDAGVPSVLEFNVRFGDPETQALLPRLRSDLLDLCERATRADGLAGAELEWSPSWAVTLVLASAGYPESSSSGDEITGLDRVGGDIEVTHAGTALRDGRLVTAGGRVLNVTALGSDIGAARAAAYAAADVIEFPGRQLRRDIALSALRRSAALAEERA